MVEGIDRRTAHRDREIQKAAHGDTHGKPHIERYTQELLSLTCSLVAGRIAPIWPAVGCQETASTLYQLKLSEFAARFAEVALLGCRELGT